MKTFAFLFLLGTMASGSEAIVIRISGEQLVPEQITAQPTFHKLNCLREGDPCRNYLGTAGTCHLQPMAVMGNSNAKGFVCKVVAPTALPMTE